MNANTIDNIDVSSLTRAAVVYYNLLQQHCQGKIQLPEETIKFMSERLLENVLLMEQKAKTIYDSFTDEEKAILAQVEEHRNNYYNDGSLIGVKGKEFANQFLDQINHKYEMIHDDAVERVKSAEDDNRDDIPR